MLPGATGSSAALGILPATLQKSAVIGPPARIASECASGVASEPAISAIRLIQLVRRRRLRGESTEVFESRKFAARVPQTWSLR